MHHPLSHSQKDEIGVEVPDLFSDFFSGADLFRPFSSRPPKKIRHIFFSLGFDLRKNQSSSEGHSLIDLIRRNTVRPIQTRCCASGWLKGQEHVARVFSN